MCIHAHLLDPLLFLHTYTCMNVHNMYTQTLSHTPDIIKLSHLGQVCCALFCRVFVPKEIQGKFLTKAMCVQALA